MIDDQNEDATTQLLGWMVARLLDHESQQQLQDELDEVSSETEAPDIVAEAAPVLINDLWYQVPLMSRQYRSAPRPKIGRNDPCPCGSGKKHKHCCEQIPLPPTLPPEALFSISIPFLDDRTWQRLIVDSRLPPAYRLEMGAFAYDQQNYEQALKAAEPLCAAPESLAACDWPVVALALDALTALGRNEQRLVWMEDILERVKAGSIRSLVHQRRAMKFMDEGRAKDSERELKQAFREDPNHDELPLTELTILAGRGDEEMLKKRAAFWKRKLQDEPNDHPLLDLCEAILEQGIAGMFGGISDPLTERLASLLGSISIKGQSEKVSSDEEFAWVTYSATLSRAIDRLIVLSDPENQPFLAVDQEDDQNPPWLEALEKKPQLLQTTPVLLLLWEWVSDPARLYTPAFAQTVVTPLLNLIVDRVKLTLSKLPKGREMAWAFLENRPFLTLAELAVDEFLASGRTDQALALLELLLRVNPNDNQALRARLADLYATTGMDEPAIALADRYKNDILLEVPMAAILAHYRRRELDEAAKRLAEATGHLKEALLAFASEQPPDVEFREWGVTVGGADQGLKYRQEMEPLWEDEPGALQWLRKQLGL